MQLLYFHFFFLSFFFLVFLPFLGPLPRHMGGSQARGLIGAVATSLCQSHSNENLSFISFFLFSFFSITVFSEGPVKILPEVNAQLLPFSVSLGISSYLKRESSLPFLLTLASADGFLFVQTSLCFPDRKKRLEGQALDFSS